ncbi:MAG TPA: SH3 domain-containing protein [Anaerolineae bacterium]
MKATVRNDYGYLRIRSAPGFSASIIGAVNGGLTVDVLAVTDNWATIPLLAGGAPITIEGTDTPATGYMYAPMLDFGVNPPPVTTPNFHIGIHSMQNSRALDETSVGCKYVMCMNFSVAESVKLAHPDATVMVRYYWGTTVPTVDQALYVLGGGRNPGLVYTGLNEADALGQDGAGLRQRATFDVGMAQALRQISGATYAAGSFSMGTPDYTSQDTCDIIRQMYAPYYNNGILKMDMHLYSPTLAQIDDDSSLIWYERRWEFLFTKCGFDPTVKGIYCSETGVDQTGKGGFLGIGASQTQFQHWCQRFIEIQKRPLVVNGISYTSPFMGASIFQLGGNGDPRWDPYDINSYLPTLRPLY